MFRSKRFSLRARLVTLTGLIVAAGFCVGIAVLTWQSGQSQRDSASLLANQIAQTTSGEIRNQLEGAFRISHALADAMAAVHEQADPSRPTADAIMRRVAESNPDYVDVWTGWEPNAFDGKDSEFVNKPGTDASGRYLTLWTRASGKLALDVSPDYDDPSAQGDWYQQPKKSGHDILTEPTKYTLSGVDVVMISTCVPIVIDGKFVGVAGVDVAISNMQQHIQSLHPYGTGYVSLISAKGVYVADGSPQGLAGKQIGAAGIGAAGVGAEEAAAVHDGRERVAWTNDPTLGRVLRVYRPVSIGGTQTSWMVAVTLPEQVVMAAVWKQRLVALALGVCTVVVVSLVLMLVLERAVLRPLGGEPGDATRLANEIAAGNLRAEAHVRPGDTVSLMYALVTMKNQLARIVQGIKVSSESITVAAVQIAAGNSDLSSRTEEQAASLGETASSMDELTGAVHHNADNARQAATMAGSASGLAQRGGQVVGQMVDTMTGISDSSARVAEIIAVIEGIAFQTNILALNAAVEAARAGEQGRGFAVVASEVRSLAQRSATAAKEIKDLIGESVGRVEAGSKLVHEAGRTIGEIVESITKVTDIVQEIASASEEQNSGITQVNQAVAQMDQVTQQNAALVEEAAAAAQSMSEQAQALRSAVAVFQTNGADGLPAGPRGQSASRPTQKAPALPARKTVANPKGAVVEAVEATTDAWEKF
ncbi:methyl-accepting chemotaxis protein [Paraburkholderia caballeronis]|uniref:methyl-accepting chemotaxis protein n=1 Tax=Paraburkholderia caballeronis TaxID=416943 RepID=UPI0010650487|nr:methyl-accepting chemotaxis protein [Paraburkholderia caballeronis]TDV09192.1 methyl-accepting chemotaxis sensory transducer with Cache sensor [Paraburkholderia caballeronis]TDV12252.1 methyl-accepting chemotaxis sensory transducer with Cache sensor [Paraburkholderia caballeronis]TDV22725.1 methyl-accepting chemotaxis sensory transducer with Cache sensor [Paraburkholderia caballeronis]